MQLRLRLPHKGTPEPCFVAERCTRSLGQHQHLPASAASACILPHLLHLHLVQTGPSPSAPTSMQAVCSNMQSASALPRVPPPPAAPLVKPLMAAARYWGSALAPRLRPLMPRVGPFAFWPFCQGCHCPNFGCCTSMLASMLYAWPVLGQHADAATLASASMQCLTDCKLPTPHA